MADERYFSRLNGYKVKDSTAREEIEKLKTAKADVTNVEELVNAVNTRVASAETSISELNTRFNYLHIPDSANEISFSGSGITSTDVQNAVLEVNSKVTQNISDIVELTSRVNEIVIPETVKEVVTGTTVLTNGVSELANDTLYVEYETGETGTSVKNLYVGINGRAVKIATGSSSGGGSGSEGGGSGSEGGGTIVPTSVELTLYGGSGETVTLTKANETVATITLGSDGTTSYTLEGTADEVYTFTAGLSGRTTTYTMGSGETNVKLRPDGFIYWYGVKRSNFVQQANSSGYGERTYTEKANSYYLGAKTLTDSTANFARINTSSSFPVNNYTKAYGKAKNLTISYPPNDFSNDASIRLGGKKKNATGSSFASYLTYVKADQVTSNTALITCEYNVVNTTDTVFPSIELYASGNGDAITTASCELIEWYFE